MSPFQLRDGQYTYAVSLTREEPFCKPFILTDVKADPLEQTNLADNPGCKDVRQELHDRLLTHLKEEKDV